MTQLMLPLSTAFVVFGVFWHVDFSTGARAWTLGFGFVLLYCESMSVFLAVGKQVLSP